MPYGRRPDPEAAAGNLAAHIGQVAERDLARALLNIM